MEWVAFPFPRGTSQPRDLTWVSHIAGRFFKVSSCLENPMDGGAWWGAVHGVAKSWTRLSDFTFTFHFHASEEEMATHSSVLAWRIPGMTGPGGLLSTGSHRVGHDWSDLAAAAALILSYINHQLLLLLSYVFSKKEKRHLQFIGELYTHGSKKSRLKPGVIFCMSNLQKLKKSRNGKWG